MKTQAASKDAVALAHSSSPTPQASGCLSAHANETSAHQVNYQCVGPLQSMAASLACTHVVDLAHDDHSSQATVSLLVVMLSSPSAG